MPNAEEAPRAAAPFIIRDCALAAIATGERAHDMRELRDKLLDIHPGSIYYHFWGTLLLPRFENPEYINDFAQWSYQALRDKVLAERLAAVDPSVFQETSQLRREVIEILEERMEELHSLPPCPIDRPFHFVRSQIVVFDTRQRVGTAGELAAAIQRMSQGSIFYHFIDARRRTSGARDDFRIWLESFGAQHAALGERLAHISPYFAPLYVLREELWRAFRDHLGGQGA